jgi:hypothetical protein
MLAVELFLPDMILNKFQKHEPYADNCAGSHLNGSVDGLIQSDNSKSAVFGRLLVSRSPGT